MGIQYGYAVVTMLPCTLWFYNAKLSGCFVAAVALWSVYNGATFYIDVFGMRFQRELEQLKKEAVKWQTLAQEMETKSAANTPLPTPSTEEVPMVGGIKAPHMKGRLGTSGVELSKEEVKERSRTTGSLPLEQ